MQNTTCGYFERDENPLEELGQGDMKWCRHTSNDVWKQCVCKILHSINL